jgi:hypothetical protein
MIYRVLSMSKSIITILPKFSKRRKYGIIFYIISRLTSQQIEKIFGDSSVEIPASAGKTTKKLPKCGISYHNLIISISTN